MDEKYVVHLLVPVVEEHRQRLAQQLATRFHIPTEKMKKRLGIPGAITKPLSKELADSVVEPLLQAGVQIAMVRENLSDLLLFEDIEDNFIDKDQIDKDHEALRAFLEDISTLVQPVEPFIPLPTPVVTKTSQPVTLGVLSLLFLILTLTLGVSFALPEPSRQTYLLQPLVVVEASILPKDEVVPIKLARLPEVLE